MQHGLDLAVVAALAGSLALWSLVAERFARWNVTAPMVFVAVGWMLSENRLGAIHVSIGGDGVREIAEIALAVVLFGDAAGINLTELGRDRALPSRLLVIGLPITIAAGALAAKLVFPDLSWWICALIGAAVAPTDAALSAGIIEDTRVPERVRTVLNVESGLNDGIATPFVNFFLVAAVAGTAFDDGTRAGALVDLGAGTLIGFAIGAAGGWLSALARQRGWALVHQREIGVAALSVLAYAITVEAGANGFVAAFVAGLGYAATAGRERSVSLDFTHDTANVLSLVVWFLFGAVMLPVLADADWRHVLFAALALTIVRMAPVAIALIGAKCDPATVAVFGWFGPRGLASVVFALLAFGELAPADGGPVLTAITMTVVLSVALHGVSAAPVARRYALYAGDRADVAGGGEPRRRNGNG